MENLTVRFIANKERLFDTDFPAEFEELVNDNKDDKEGNEKDKDIIEMRKKAEKRYKDVKNLLPKESVIRSALKYDNY